MPSESLLFPSSPSDCKDPSSTTDEATIDCHDWTIITLDILCPRISGPPQRSISREPTFVRRHISPPVYNSDLLFQSPRRVHIVVHNAAYERIFLKYLIKDD